MITSKKITRTTVIGFAFLAYHFAKDIVKIGIKEGKATHALIAKK
ncbi:MAG: hypothetical protein JWR38_4037 [Mucilaginibacter sp.]|nr:hypothetical protein [Mucilaginibacter sp.]